MKCLGIFRERQNSPDRQTDDALILRAVMEQLQNRRVETHLLEPEAADQEDLGGWDMIVPMCESYPRLMRLKTLLLSQATMIINPPQAVLGCYRSKMLEAFRRCPGFVFPETELRVVAGNSDCEPPAFDAGSGLWIKRGDVHNTCDRDVVFARNPADVKTIRSDFESREISTMLIQKHVDGNVIKFYGVGPGQWFTWFYHDPGAARKLPFKIETLAFQAETAARAVGLEIFGGDAIISPDGPIFIIDINSWPSFARVRAEAAMHIARHLLALSRATRREGVKV